MHIAQDIIAVRDRIHDNTHRADIINFVNRLVLSIHFAINGINMLNACGNRMLNICLGQLAADAVLNPFQELFLLLALFFQSVDNLIVANRVEALER